MSDIAFDTETYLIRPGQAAPKMVCGSFAWYTEPALPPYFVAPIKTDLQLTDPALITVGGFIEGGDTLIGQNVAFDAAVICAALPEMTATIFQAYKRGQIQCTKIRQQLIDIESGTYRGKLGPDNQWVKYGYSLEEMVPRLLGQRCEKDGFRMFYAHFDGVPLDQWEKQAKAVQEFALWYKEGINQQSEEAKKFRHLMAGSVKDKDIEGLINADPRRVIEYPLDDARLTLQLYSAQKALISDKAQADSIRQAQFYFAIRLAEVWGIRTNVQLVEQFAGKAQETFDELQAVLLKEGLVRYKNEKKQTGDISRNTAAAKERMLAVENASRDAVSDEGGVHVPFTVRRTATGEVCLDNEACLASGDDLLIKYTEYSTLSKVLSTDVEMLRKGVILPMHCSFGLAETGRVTVSKPNLANVRGVPGIRECFVPRPGRVFIQADYPGLELFTLAQVCIDRLGQSHLAEVLRTGEDPHLQLAATILGITYAEAKKRKGEDEVKKARAMAKVANFGFPGGLGPKRFVEYANANKQTKKLGIDYAKARELKSLWLATWPEMREYFRYIESLEETPGFYVIEHVKSERIRGGATYTAACNSLFQGLGADATKAAVFAAQEEWYTVSDSPLYGARVVNYVYDEIIAEAEEDRASVAAVRLADVMISEANKWLVDVPIPRDRMEPTLMRVWSKDAKQVFDDKGNLIPWEP